MSNVFAAKIHLKDELKAANESLFQARRRFGDARKKLADAQTECLSAEHRSNTLAIALSVLDDLDKPQDQGDG